MWPGQKWSYSQKSDFIKRLTIDLLIPKLHQQDESPMVHLWGTSGGVLRDAAPKQQLQPMSKKRSQPRRRSSNQPQSSVMLLQLMPLDLLPGCCSHIFNEMRLLARGQKSHPWCPSVCMLSSVLLLTGFRYFEMCIFHCMLNVCFLNRVFSPLNK